MNGQRHFQIWSHAPSVYRSLDISNINRGGREMASLMHSRINLYSEIFILVPQLLSETQFYINFQNNRFNP